MHWPPRLLLLTLIGAAFALAVHVDFPLCPLAGTFGIPCPGCGLTRATLALLHGDLRAALRFHPLVWLLAPLFAALLGGAVFELLRPPSQAPRRRSGWNARAVSVLGTALFIAVFGVWIARFAGHFGGPAPVTSLGDWLAAHH